MPTFQFLLHTAGINHPVKGASDTPATGFYAVRRTKAKNEDDASEAVVREFKADKKISKILQSGHDAGLQPKTEIEEMDRISWLEALIPWQHPGLIFYNEEESGESPEDEDTDP